MPPKPSILMVDDEELVLGFLKLAPRPTYNVYFATNATQAIEVFKNCSTKISVLVTDILMPGMNGQQLAETLLKLQPDLKVIYISGCGIDLNLPPGTAFLQKPFTKGQLMEMLDRVLK